MVHYHTVGFQLIFCYRGWVRLVYEDQGDPFILSAGDCVIQPPQIRHRVLEASDNVEVLEIGVPAEHITTIDHEMELPNGTGDPDRTWDGTKFVHHKEAGATWTDWRLPGWEARDTGIGDGTAGVAGVQVARPKTAEAVTLEARTEGRDSHALEAGDAFVIPPFLETRLTRPSQDCELIEVTLPARFTTTIET